MLPSQGRAISPICAKYVEVASGRDKRHIGTRLAPGAVTPWPRPLYAHSQEHQSLAAYHADELLLNAHNMDETIIGSTKEFSLLHLPRHCLPLNAFLHTPGCHYRLSNNPINPGLNSLQFIRVPLHSRPENSLLGLDIASSSPARYAGT